MIRTLARLTLVLFKRSTARYCPLAIVNKYVKAAQEVATLLLRMPLHHFRMVLPYNCNEYRSATQRRGLEEARLDDLGLQRPHGAARLRNTHLLIAE